MQITWTYALATPFDQMVKLARTLHIHCRRKGHEGEAAKHVMNNAHLMCLRRWTTPSETPLAGGLCHLSYENLMPSANHLLLQLSFETTLAHQPSPPRETVLIRQKNRRVRFAQI